MILLGQMIWWGSYLIAGISLLVAFTSVHIKSWYDKKWRKLKYPIWLILIMVFTFIFPLINLASSALLWVYIYGQQGDIQVRNFLFKKI